MAENQWNWNVPGGAPGYGPLEPGTDIAALLAQAIGAVPAAAPSADAPVVASREDVIEGTATACTAKEQSAAPQQAGRQDEPVVQPILPSDCEPAVVVATQHASVVEPLAGTPRHRHGGALPG